LHVTGLGLDDHATMLRLVIICSVDRRRGDDGSDEGRECIALHHVFSFRLSTEVAGCVATRQAANTSAWARYTVARTPEMPKTEWYRLSGDREAVRCIKQPRSSPRRPSVASGSQAIKGTSFW